MTPPVTDGVAVPEENAEEIEWRSGRWLIVDSEEHVDPNGNGSHWHLTVTGPTYPEWWGMHGIDQAHNVGDA